MIVPNEYEGGIISGRSNVSKGNVNELILDFAKKGVTAVVILGGDGCAFYDDGRVKYQDAIETTVVDTTAAGDSFIGGMCVALCEGKPFAEAIWFATKVSGIVVGRKGAETSIPFRDEVES